MIAQELFRAYNINTPRASCAKKILKLGIARAYKERHRATNTDVLVAEDSSSRTSLDIRLMAAFSEHCTAEIEAGK